LDAGKFWVDLHVICGFLYAAASSLMRVTEMLLELVSVFLEVSQHFRYFSQQTRKPIDVKPTAHVQKAPI
jgi:hypothetical protein